MGELHTAMLECGYKYLASKHRKAYERLADISSNQDVYVKEFSTTEGIFKVALVFDYDPYTSLPWTHIMEKPAHLKDVLLPHVNNGGYLCYVEELEADWNPNNLQGIYNAVDKQIQKTLENSINSLNSGQVEQTELEGEFAAYWKPEYRVYALSSFDSLHGHTSILTTNKFIDNSDRQESILYSNNTKDIHQKWLMQRDLYEFDSKKLNTVIIKVRPNRLSGVNWPPKDSIEFLEWLSVVDHNAKAHLIKYFVEHPFKHHLILLEVDKQDTLGLVLELNQKAVQFSTYANNKKSGKRGRKFDLGRASSVLSGRYAFNKFQKISFAKADEDTILSRNRSRPEIGDLRPKFIALIGCGTIGGYAAELLIRSGAGMGVGSFHLYDPDTYGPHNFGRHTLNSRDFGKNKAVALQESLESATHLTTNIKALKMGFPLTADALSLYDIIIDATGRGPIAKRLAYLLRQVKGTKKPIIIHGFNDGNGLASKVFIDYSDACYSCLCGDPAFYNNGIDNRFVRFAHLNVKKVSCGNTYTPYDAAVSITTAALIQEATLSTLEPERNWNYKEHIFVGIRSKKPSWIGIKTFCEICNAE